MMDSSCTHRWIIESIIPSVIIKNWSRRQSLSQLTYCITKPRVWVRNMNHKWFSIQLFTIGLIKMGGIWSGCHQLSAWFSTYLSFLFCFSYVIISAYAVESLLLPFLFFFMHSSSVLQSFLFSLVPTYSFFAVAVKLRGFISTALFLEGPQCVLKFSLRSSLRSTVSFRWC